MAKAPEAFGFREPAASTLEAIARRQGLVARNKPTIKYPSPNIQTSGGYFAKVPLTGIPARSGATPGQATCDVYKIIPDGAGYTISDAQFTVDIFNVFPLAVAFDAAFPYFNVHQDQFGRWLNEAPNPAAANTVLYKLTGNLNIGGGFANAVLRTFNGTTYVDGAAIKVYDPYAQTSHSPGLTQGFWTGQSGMEGAAVKRAVDSGGTPEYDIVYQEQYARVIAFTLGIIGLNLPGGNFGYATVDRVIDGILPPLDAQQEIKVHDDQNLFPNALGKNSAMEGGATGWAIRNEQLGTPGDPYYHVIQCDQRCILARARLGQTMCGEQHFRVIIEGFEASTKAPFGQVPKPLPTQALNPHKHRGRNDGRWVELKWGKARDPDDEEGGSVEGWIIHDVPKDKLKVPFQYRARHDNTGTEMRIKEIAIESCEDDQWVPMLDGEPCTPP